MALYSGTGEKKIIHLLFLLEECTGTDILKGMPNLWNFKVNILPHRSFCTLTFTQVFQDIPLEPDDLCPDTKYLEDVFVLKNPETPDIPKNSPLHFVPEITIKELDENNNQDCTNKTRFDFQTFDSSQKTQISRAFLDLIAHCLKIEIINET